MVLDVFAIGFLSCSAAGRFPIGAIKIERSFVSRLDGAGESAVVAAILSMAGALGASTVAGGIETEAQLRRLRSMGCEFGQGFHASWGCLGSSRRVGFST